MWPRTGVAPPATDQTLQSSALTWDLCCAWAGPGDASSCPAGSLAESLSSQLLWNSQLTQRQFRGNKTKQKRRTVTVGSQIDGRNQFQSGKEEWGEVKGLQKLRLSFWSVRVHFFSALFRKGRERKKLSWQVRDLHQSHRVQHSVVMSVAW